MEYQVPTYFAKLTFLCSLFPVCQVHFAKMLGCQVHIAKLSTSHCRFYVVNFTLPNHQLHIVNATLPCQVEFVFQADQMFFRPPQNNFKNSLPNA
jgi:hypothetical protein